MPFQVEMTGAQDYQRTIKMAVCGYPGAGKTLLSSTAPQPFFIFFREQPRMMSIADRYIPHTKVANKFDESGRLVTPCWETLLEVIDYLDGPKGKDYGSVVIDTGDELFQALKEGKKAQNRGKFAIQDWGWLGDTYREIINRVIDLPKHVIVTYHLKNTQEGDDGEIVREIALQGQAKDEVAGWFDLVGVLDSWEEETQEGKILHRGMLTHTTPKYPFVKDHSGKLPKLFEISDNFVGDFKRLHDLIYADVPAADHEVIETVTPEPKTVKKEKTSAETGVPTPDDIAKKKGVKDADGASDDTGSEGQDSAVEGGEAPSESSPAEETTEAATEGVEEKAVDTASPDAGASEEGSADEAVGDAESTDQPTDGGGGPSLEEAAETVEKELGATEVSAIEGAVTCEYDGPPIEIDGETEDRSEGDFCGRPLVKRKTNEDGDPVADENGEIIMMPDQDLMDLTKIRFRKYMCREHFTQARKG